MGRGGEFPRWVVFPGGWGVEGGGRGWAEGVGCADRVGTMSGANHHHPGSGPLPLVILGGGGHALVVAEAAFLAQQH